MDPVFVGYYERELKHVREMGGEFARQFPKIAGRLGLDAFACADPYVERLIEAFAFMAARVQLKLGAAHAEFTQHMLELLYPGYLAPTPSMAVMQLAPNLREGSLASGVTVPRGSTLRSALGEQQTACDFRTAHPVTLWPFELTAADYTTNPGQLLDMERVAMPSAQAALRLTLRASRGATFDTLPVESLPLFLRGGGETATRLYEQLLGANVGMVVQSANHPRDFMSVVRRRTVGALGFESDQALLPVGNRGFDGYRLLHELFAFPERYSFVELLGLREALQAAKSSDLEIVLLFDRPDARLDGVVRASSFALFCTPAINLFPRSSDRILLNERDHEHHVVPDRMRPLDFEVHTVTRVQGFGAGGDALCEFQPMYAPRVGGLGGQRARACYTVRRQPYALRPHLFAHEQDARTQYVPSEAFIALVDADHGASRAALRQLSVSTLCTNRALPLMLHTGEDGCTFTEQSGAPVGTVRCIAGPTPPRASPVHGDLAWALLSHLQLDYLTLLRRGESGASAVRELLGLYARYAGPDHSTQLDGIVDVKAKSVVRPLTGSGPMVFGRGIEVTLACDESAFAGTGAFLLSAVLARFFAKYASINSFAETVLRTQQRGEVMRWATVPGQRSTL